MLRGIWYILLVCLSSCSTPDSTKSISTASTPDTFFVSVDPSWEGLLSNWTSTYNALNTYQYIQVRVLPEKEVAQQFFSNSIPVAFLSRGLSIEEQNYLVSKKRFIDRDTVAYDAIACIVPLSFPDSMLRLEDVQSLFQTGKWKSKEYSLVFNSNGGAVPYYLETILGKPASSSHLYAVGSDEQIIENVKNSTATIGFISSYKLSDAQNPKHRALAQGIKVLGLWNNEKKQAIWPVQEHIYTQWYPLVRPLVFLNYDRKEGIGTSFISFIREERGQRIVLKAGLLPHEMPARIVSIQ